MRTIDGSEGGGQVVRTALALSALAGEPVRVESVRGARPEPGLKPQHLAAVRALAAVTDADVEGADPGSGTLTFDPGPPRPGEYAVEVGTAGSVTLVFDAVLPLAARIDGRLALTVTGGTDVKWSPSADYYRRAKLPLLRRSGVLAAVDVDRRGFYPAGGGRATLAVGPSEPSVALTDRGDLRGARVYATADASLADAEVARRGARAAAERLDDAGVEVSERSVARADAASPGAVVAVALDYEGSIAGFDALGERGKPVEDVAGDAVDAALAHRSGTAAVDRHAADQLLPLLAVGGGALRAPEVTAHVDSLLSVLEAFGYDVTVDPDPGGVVLAAEGRRPGDRIERD